MKPFELAPLPYAYDYLEPVIDAETMKLHHDKHHQAYVNNLNAAIAKYPDLAYGCVDCILGDIANVPEDIRQAVINNGGGHKNHTMFWEIMTKPDTSKIARPFERGLLTLNLVATMRLLKASLLQQLHVLALVGLGL